MYLFFALFQLQIININLYVVDKNLINQNTKKYKYVYVFNEGRSERLNSEKFPKDFFYFYSELKKK